VIVTLSYSGLVEITLNGLPPKGCATEVPDSTCEVYLHIKGLVDFNLERAKLVTKRKGTIDGKEQVEKRRAQADYAHVPQVIKERDDEKLLSLEQELASIDKAIATLDQLIQEEKQ